MADSSFDVEYLLRKRHNIVEFIFEYLDNKSLTTCREVSNSWKNFIDKRNYPWTRIVDKFYPKEVDKIGKEIMIETIYLSFFRHSGVLSFFTLLSTNEITALNLDWSGVL